LNEMVRTNYSGQPGVELTCIKQSGEPDGSSGGSVNWGQLLTINNGRVRTSGYSPDMARPLRIEKVGGWYHITARGNERKTIYRDNRDRQHFCELLAEMTERFRLRLHTFVLMENHYHLLMELREANLSRAVQWLNVSYSVWFNRRHARSGHLFQGRFKSVVVSPEEWALGLSRYIHLNPVRLGKLGLGKAEQKRKRTGLAPAPNAAQVGPRIALLRRYRWSSYRAYLGIGVRPKWLECEAVLALGGGSKEDRRRHYRNYVEEAVREGLEKSPWEEVREQVVLGSQEFLTQLRAQQTGNARQSQALARMARARPDWASVVACLEKVKGEKWEEFRDRHGDSGRNLALYLGRREGGLTLAELAKGAGLKGEASVAMCVMGFGARLDQDPAERERLKTVTQMLIVRS